MVNVKEFRQEAWKRFEALPWPTKTDEEWRRTDPAQLHLSEGEFDSRGSLPILAKARTSIEGEQDVPAFQAGWEELPSESVRDGVIVTDLDTALRQFPELVEEHLFRTGTPQGLSKFIALHQALFHPGIFCYIPEGVRVRLPIRCWVEAQGGNGPIFPHTLLVVGAGAEVTVIDERRSDGEPRADARDFSRLAASAAAGAVGSATTRPSAAAGAVGSATTRPSAAKNVGVGRADVRHFPELAAGAAKNVGVGAQPLFADEMVEIVIQEGASLRYLHLQRWNLATTQLYTQRAVLKRDAQFFNLLVGLGSCLTKAQVETELSEPGSRSDLLGVFFEQADQHFDFHTLQDHRAPHTTSDLLYKSALKDRSQSIYTGLIRIRKEAQKSDAYQANRNLLLSQGAKADSVPMLEIEADDVRCTHGVAVGPVDEEQSFYLMSRGLPRPEAERLIVEGFFEQVFKRVPLGDLQEQLMKEVSHRLNGRA